MSVFSCEGLGGLQCSGNGICSDGDCVCDPGHGGNVCQIDYAPVSGAPYSCPSVNGTLCDGHGTCEEGECVCYFAWGGKACEMQLHKTGFCNLYRACAECVAFGQKCTENCNNSAVFRLVEELPTSGMDHIFHRCRYRSDIHQCSFFYQLGTELLNGKKVILVKSCPDWLIALLGSSTAPTVARQPDGQTMSPIVVAIEVTSAKPTRSAEKGDSKGHAGSGSLPAAGTCQTVWLLFLCLIFIKISFTIL